MDLPKPPEDIELKNVIDKLANFVARNGPEFERMTKEKQRDNPRFGFLFGGEYFNYYQYRVTTEQAILRQQQQKQQALGLAGSPAIPPSAPWQQQSQQQMQLQQQQLQVQDQLDQLRQTAANQIQQSEQNLAAQYTSLMQQQQIQIDDTVEKIKVQHLIQMCDESGISLSELDSVVQPIIDSCTKEAISNGKNWVFARCNTELQTAVFAEYLRKRVFDPNATFELRLHLIYLINDILHHSLRRSVETLKMTLASVVVPIYCLTFLNVDDDRRQKLAKLLSLWEQNQYFDATIVQSMKDAPLGWNEYKNALLSNHGDVVSSVSLEISQRYASLQQQHQDYVNHFNNQIRQLEQQLQMITQQLIASGIPPPIAASTTPGPLNIPLPSRVPGPPASVSVPPPFHPNFAPPPRSRFGGPPPGFMQGPPPNSFDQLAPPPVSGSVPPMMASEYGMPPSVGGGTIPPLMPPDFEYGGQGNEYGGSKNGIGSDYGQGHGDGEYGPSGGEYGGPNEYGRGHPSGPPPQGGGANIDLSRPPPGFLGGMGGGFLPGPPPSLLDLPSGPPPPRPEDLVPKVPYYDLPAGLMVPLVKLESTNFEPLDPKDIRLPPPMPPNERLLAAVEAFYAPPSHERPRDSDGWEKLGLYEFYRAKQKAKKDKEEAQSSSRRSRSRSKSRSRSNSRSRSPRRYSNKRNSRSKSRTRSRSPAYRRSSRSRSHSRSRSRSHSPRRRGGGAGRRPSPPNHDTYPNLPLLPDPILITAAPDIRLGMENKGHQLLTKMGWGGGGLGLEGQGIMDPVSGGEVRDRNDMYKGVGIAINDPFEQFRKSKAHGYGASRSKPTA